jgi:alkylation response protein AidB-like acyl-CoA dehydrogenase
VDVRFSSEQVALRDSVAQVVDRFGAKAVGQLDDAERIAKLDAAVEASGWRDLRTADDDGAPWASAVEVAIVAEELARGVADAAFVGPTLAAELRRLTGTEPASAAETVALTADLGALGAAVAIDAAGATTVLALVGADLVEAAPSDALPETDLTRPAVGVGPAIRTIGGLSAEAATRVTALGLAVSCADLVGVMRGAVTLATDYAKDRRQYGAAIGSFQAVQHLLADAHVLAEGSRSVAIHAAWAVDALPPEEALAAAAGAKAYCARSARAVGETVIQVHGGIGNTWECMAHVFLRRALLSSDILGGVGPSLDKVLAHHGIGSANGLR